MSSRPVRWSSAEAEPEAAGQAHLAMAGSLTSLGSLEEALRYFERARELSRGSVSLIIGTLPGGACAGVECSRALVGRGTQSARPAACQEAVDLARATDHPYSLAVALGYAATTYQLIGNRTRARDAASELIETCQRYSFGFYGEWGVVVDGWLKGGEAGAERIRKGIDTLRSAGQLARMPYWLYLLADVTARAGHARTRLERSWTRLAPRAEQRDELWWLPELLRAGAQLLGTDAAVPLLRRAALLAKSQRSERLEARCERRPRRPRRRTRPRRIGSTGAFLRRSADANGCGNAEVLSVGRPKAARSSGRPHRRGRSMTTTSPARASASLDRRPRREPARCRRSRPSDPGYDKARAVYNGAVDRRPLAVARCADVADVIACVDFARENELHARGPRRRSQRRRLRCLGRRAGDRPRGAAQHHGRPDRPHRPRRRGLHLGRRRPRHRRVRHGHSVRLPVARPESGGLTLGGGIGYLTRRFGLTVDNLLAADVVLADGTLRHRQRRARTPDLFWAMRGGGGNFGVVTSFTFRCHDDRRARHDHRRPGAVRHRRHRGRHALVPGAAAGAAGGAQRLDRDGIDDPAGAAVPRGALGPQGLRHRVVLHRSRTTRPTRCSQPMRDSAHRCWSGCSRCRSRCCRARSTPCIPPGCSGTGGRTSSTEITDDAIDAAP